MLYTTPHHTYIHMEIKTTPFDVIKGSGRLEKWRTWLNKLLVGLKHPLASVQYLYVHNVHIHTHIIIYVCIFSSIIKHNDQQTPSISFVLYAPCLSVFKGLMDEVFLYFYHRFHHMIFYTYMNAYGVFTTYM